MINDPYARKGIIEFQDNSDKPTLPGEMYIISQEYDRRIGIITTLFDINDFVDNPGLARGLIADGATLWAVPIRPRRKRRCVLNVVVW